MPKTMATAPTSLQPVVVSFAREGRDEQHINAISRRGQFDRTQNPIGWRRFAPSYQGASIGLARSRSAFTRHCCSAATGHEGGDPVADLISRTAPEAC